MELLSFSDGIDGAAETSVWLLLSNVCISINVTMYTYIHTYIHTYMMAQSMWLCTYTYIHTYIHDGTISVQSHCEKVMLNYIPFTHTCFLFGWSLSQSDSWTHTRLDSFYHFPLSYFRFLVDCWRYRKCNNARQSWALICCLLLLRNSAPACLFTRDVIW